MTNDSIILIMRFVYTTFIIYMTISSKCISHDKKKRANCALSILKSCGLIWFLKIPLLLTVLTIGWTFVLKQVNESEKQLTLQRSLYCLFWKFAVPPLPDVSSTYPRMMVNAVLWMALAKCMWSWSIAVWTWKKPTKKHQQSHYY